MNSHDRQCEQVASETVFGSFLRTIGLLRRTMEPFFASQGISGAQWGVLAALHRSEHEGKPSLRLTDLGEQLIIRPPSVTMMVDRLERLGLVRRETSKSDSRAKEVELTEAGRQLVERVLAAHRAQMDRVFGSLSAAEQAEIKRLLDKISGNLEVMERGLNRSDNGGYPR